jgi:hypothetical protein
LACWLSPDPAPLEEQCEIQSPQWKGGVAIFDSPLAGEVVSKQLLDGAFRRDYEGNGPSLFRMARTMLQGWRRYRNDPDPRVRARVGVMARQLRTGYGASLWAMERFLRGSNRKVSDRIRALRLEVGGELGGLARLTHNLLGPFLLWTSRREARRFPAGRPLEPRTFVERRNWPASATEHTSA